MRATLTIRMGAALQDALAKRAEAEGKTVSELVRELLERALAVQPLATKTAHVKGQLRLSRRAADWRRRLRARNWRE